MSCVPRAWQFCVQSKILVPRLQEQAEALLVPSLLHETIKGLKTNRLFMIHHRFDVHWTIVSIATRHCLKPADCS